MQIRNLPRDLQERAWEYNQRAKESWVLKASSFTEFLNISLIDAFDWGLAEEGVISGTQYTPVVYKVGIN